jgi:hypothetical protein
MSKNMDVVGKEDVLIFRSENIIINGIERDYFYKMLDKYGYTFKRLKLIFESGIYDSSEQHELNHVLRRLKSIEDISLMSSIICLEELAQFKNILGFLDGDTKVQLKEECAVRYNIKLEKNSLHKLMKF